MVSSEFKFKRPGAGGSDITLPGLAGGDSVYPWNLLMSATSAWACSYVATAPTVVPLWNGIFDNTGGGANSGIWRCRCSTDTPFNADLNFASGYAPIAIAVSTAGRLVDDYYIAAWNLGAQRFDITWKTTADADLTTAGFTFFVIAFGPRDRTTQVAQANAIDGVTSGAVVV